MSAQKTGSVRDRDSFGVELWLLGLTLVLVLVGLVLPPVAALVLAGIAASSSLTALWLQHRRFRRGGDPIS